MQQWFRNFNLLDSETMNDAEIISHIKTDGDKYEKEEKERKTNAESKMAFVVVQIHLLCHVEMELESRTVHVVTTKWRGWNYGNVLSYKQVSNRFY